jgi:hypothetical protein
MIGDRQAGAGVLKNRVADGQSKDTHLHLVGVFFYV